MSITKVPLNWTRETRPGVFPARYSTRRGRWSWTITARRKTGSTLRAYRDGVLVLEERADNLKAAKALAPTVLSAAESLVWSKVYGGRYSYEAQCGGDVFRTLCVNGAYQLFCERDGTNYPGAVYGGMALVRKAVAELLDPRTGLLRPVSALQPRQLIHPAYPDPPQGVSTKPPATKWKGASC